MLIVDAANVVGSRPTGWWRDRPGAARDFVARLRLATAEGKLTPPTVAVLEGAARRGVDEGEVDGVRVVHAPGSGDDRLADLAKHAAADGAAVTLVTADRGLRERVRCDGVDVVGPSWLWSRLENAPTSPA
jgi:hypothetical protein